MRTIFRVLGVDPGIEGALAVYCTDPDDANHKTIEVLDVPTAGEDAKRRVNAPAIRDWIRRVLPDVAYIENVGSMPDQGVASSFRFGRATGALEAIVACCDVPIERVAPVTWKKFYGLKGPDKEPSRELAIRKFPFMAHVLTRKLDHQRAESMLIAHYGYLISGESEQRA